MGGDTRSVPREAWPRGSRRRSGVGIVVLAVFRRGLRGRQRKWSNAGARAAPRAVARTHREDAPRTRGDHTAHTLRRTRDRKAFGTARSGRVVRMPWRSPWRW